MNKTRPVGGPSLRPLLAMEALFMVGFSSVVPFLAAIAQDRYAFDASAVGLLIGARVAAQQGLFLLGGVLADRMGARLMVALGCLMRAAGLAAIALAAHPGVFVAGVIVVGMAAALFSPALEGLVGAADARWRRDSGRRGPAPFAALAMAGEAGAVTAACLAAPHMPGNAGVVALVAAGIFLAVGIGSLFLLPSSPIREPKGPAPEGTDVQPELTHSERHTPLVPVVLAGSVFLALYSQLFSLIPLGLAERGADAGLMGLVVVVWSLSTLALQWPLSRVAERAGRRRAVVAGLVLGMAGCLAAALGMAVIPDAALAAAVVPATVLLGASTMLGSVAARSLAASGGSARWRSTRLAAVPTAGGAAALLLSALTGAVARDHGLTAAWLIAAALPLVALTATAAVRVRGRARARGSEARRVLAEAKAAA
ncbi:MFS transporter [Sinomonas mesophila]|uniref:MFS transporter n=1 Tax=Sinomonas mesophila TaxID=1531955 RepID=UPI00098484B8|nr:MFS transporter [Sinomonas mesophila]